MSSDLLQFPLVFLVGVATGFLAAICGGGGLLSIPALVLLGLPAQTAIATNRFAAVGLWVTALGKYRKEGKVVDKYVLPLSLIALFGGLIGSQLLSHSKPQFLDQVVAFVILGMLPIVYFSDRLSLQSLEPTLLRRQVGYFLFFLVTIFGGFFSGGDGTLGLYVLMSCFGLSITQASGTRGMPWLCLGLTSVTTFVYEGLVDYRIAAALLPGMCVGAYYGAHTAIKKGDHWVKRIFAGVVATMALKLLLNF